jgi:predicted HicB family RNase H-like nuclease
MDKTVKMSVKVSNELHKKIKEDANSRALTLNATVIFILEEHYKGK